MPSVYIPASKAVHEMLAAMHLLLQATSLCPHLVFWKYRQSPKQKHMWTFCSSIFKCLVSHVSVPWFIKWCVKFVSHPSESESSPIQGCEQALLDEPKAAVYSAAPLLLWRSHSNPLYFFKPVWLRKSPFPFPLPQPELSAMKWLPTSLHLSSQNSLIFLLWFGPKAFGRPS